MPTDSFQPHVQLSAGRLRAHETEKSPEVSPLLTVCIPTYNRADLLRILIITTVNTLRREFGPEFEVLVSENHSKDYSYQVLKELQGSIRELRIVQPPVHLPTAEQNLLFALQQCRGKFIWTLGDDDSIEPEAVSHLKVCLERDDCDLFIFNSRSHAFSGETLRDVRIPCLSTELDINLLEFVQLTGFWFVISGFSTTIFRNSDLNLDSFVKILDIGKIYSHVTWLIYTFHDRRFRFENMPLVAYRQNVSDVKPTGHWETVSQREKIFSRSIWTNTFLRQMDFLIENEIIDRSFLHSVVDRNLERRFYFADQIFLHMIDSVIDWLIKKIEIIPLTECEYFLEWCPYLYPNNIRIIDLFQNVFSSTVNGRHFDGEEFQLLVDIYHSRARNPWYWRFHRYDAYGYSIYMHGARWFSIRADLNMDVNIQRWLEYVDFGDFGDLVIVATDEQALRNKLSTLSAASFGRDRIDPVVRASVAELYLRLSQSHSEPVDLTTEAPRLGGAAHSNATGLQRMGLLDERHSGGAQANISGSPNSNLVQDLMQQSSDLKKIAELEDIVSQLRSSTSWRVTAPLRWLKEAFIIK